MWLPLNKAMSTVSWYEDWMLKFALQAGLTPGNNLTEKLTLLTAWGFDGIEVSGTELLQHGDELRAAQERFPVRICSAIGGASGWLVDPNPRARALLVREVKPILAACQEFGVAGLVMPASFGISARGVLPPFRNVFSHEEYRRVLIDSLQQIAADAEETGGVLLLEPLNRYEDAALNTLAEGVLVIEEVGSPAIRLMPDFFHMNIEEADIAASLRAAARHIGHVHLADSNRLLPGLGHTDFAASFAALQQSGYDGALAIECRVTGNPMVELPRALDFLRTAADAPT